MKNNKYLEILKYILIGYAAIRLIDIAQIVIMNISGILKYTSGFFGSIFSAFSIILTGFVIAYILDPPVSFICRKTPVKSRFLAAALAYMLIALLIAGFLYFIFKKINSMGGTNIGENVILVINRTVDEFINGCLELTSFISHNGFSGISSDILAEITSYTTKFIKYIGRSFADIVSMAGTITVKTFIGFVVGFYFLKDKEKIKKGLDKNMNVIFPKIYGVIKEFLKDVHMIFLGYFKGQLTDALILAFMTSVLLSIVRIRFAVPIGIIAGFLNIIPYVGAITGFVLAVIAGIISGSLKKAVIAGIIMIIVQQIDSVFLSPKIVGKSVDLHPVIIIAVLMAAGNLFGIIGMFFAVPVTALIKHIFNKYYLQKKLEKNK